jgi:hypothetical protein
VGIRAVFISLGNVRFGVLGVGKYDEVYRVALLSGCSEFLSFFYVSGLFCVAVAL